ncbi:MAG: CDP-6-deoxy-delta-3,4-glucoseen reductase [Zoogloeaceae bacterium]|nr:CDP-6-deoxy-delta-3,4-glucoseen reductase [Zoogloeaceae bacterium]
MSYQVTFQPSGHTISAEPDQSVLESAIQAGLLVPYGCRDGACGACKATLNAGHVMLDQFSPTALTPDDIAAGMTLLCRAHPTGDLVLTVRNVQRAGDIPIKKLPCRVQRLQRLAPDVMRLEVKLPASEQFRFLAGQYVDFLLSGGRRRSFSIANRPEGAVTLEFHIRRIDGGEFTGHVFNSMKEKEILRFEGPLGSFFLREDSQAPIILLAGGTGFAPIKGLVEHAIEAGITRPMTLYWGARNRAGLYLADLAESWTRALPGFKFVPVLSDSSEEDAWTGRTGMVHHAVMADFPDLSGHQVYACGAPPMIDAARQDFQTRCGLADDAFFADAFTYSTDSPA